MLRKILLTLVLTLLLGFGQQSALLHEISHYADLDPAALLDKSPQHAGHCDHCVGIGHIAHGLVGHQHFDFGSTPQLTPYADEPRSHAGPIVRIYAARAPPRLT